MPIHHVTVETPIVETFRVAQVAGMFDCPVDQRAKQEWTVEVPGLEEAWSIGVIVGPSGSGKTTVARDAYGKNLWQQPKWPAKESVLDGFDKDVDVRAVTHALTSVGFSSPPSWLKPYHVLSNGEKFRCDLARALVSGRDVVAYDEFTSVVDRTVAKIGSAAVSKAIRAGKVGRRFVAVTCHYDVVEWLEPDWVLDMASGQLARGRLQRPRIQLAIAPIDRSAWILFKRHHYLSGNLSTAAKCFAAFVDNEPVAFSAWVSYLSKKRNNGAMREHRTVVLPDYQGIGIGNRLSEFCASIYRGLGRRAYSTTSHPAMIRYRSKSKLWHRKRMGMVNPTGRASAFGARGLKSSVDRVTAGFEYVGPGLPRDVAASYVDPRLLSRPFGGDLTTAITRCVAKYPGARLSLIARQCGESSGVVKKTLERLTRDGLIVSQGRGGRDPRGYFVG